MNRNLFGSVRRDVLDLCESASEPLEFIREVGSLFARAVPRDAWAMHAVDPATLLPGCGAADVCFSNDVNWEIARREFVERDVNMFADLARSTRGVAALQLTTAGVPQASLRFKDFERPFGISDELRVTFVANSACWGISTFLRTGRVPFSAGEVDFISSLTACISSALRRVAWVGAEVRAPRFSPAIVILNNENRIEEATSEAVTWLEELKVIGAFMEPSLPLVATIVADQTRGSVEQHLPGGDFRRVRTTSGTWVSLRGARLRGTNGNGDGGRVALTIEPASSDEIAEFLLTGHCLSPREREIAWLLAHGRASKDIAQMLHVSPHTVRDHVKKVFEKLAVHTRAELIAKLFLDSTR